MVKYLNTNKNEKSINHFFNDFILSGDISPNKTI